MTSSPEHHQDAPAGPPAPRYEARRLEIVDIAAHLFAQKGYHATSLDDLCEATGLKRGGLYHYIGSKEELLYQIHERFINPLLESAREVERRYDSPEQTLRELARVLMGVIADFNDQVTVFLHEWRSVADRTTGRARSVRQARTEFEAVIKRTLERGIADGTFEEQDPTLSTLAFLGLINYAYQWYRPGGPFTAELVADRFCDIFLYGISSVSSHDSGDAPR